MPVLAAKSVFVVYIEVVLNFKSDYGPLVDYDKFLLLDSFSKEVIEGFGTSNPGLKDLFKGSWALTASTPLSRHES